MEESEIGSLDSTVFWGVEIKPNSYAATACAPRGGSLHITHATIGSKIATKTATGSSRVVVIGEADGNKIVICSLRPEVQENVALNLRFTENMAINVEGPYTVHLSGYTENRLSMLANAPIPGLYSYDDDDDEDEMEEESEIALSMIPKLLPHTEQMKGDGPSDDDEAGDAAGDEEDDEEDEDEDAQDENEQDENAKPESKKALSQVKSIETKVKSAMTGQQNSAQTISGKRKPEQKEKVSEKKQKTDTKTNEHSSQAQNNQKKPNNPTNASASTKSTSELVALPNGLKYKDIEVGKGAPVKTGKQLSVRYRGLLTSGKQFDSNMPKGHPFDFFLGAGEVIKGWDQGMQGMKVGGKRQLVIPPHLGYGTRGAPPDIPPNATLLFEVHLLAAK